jgi:hypothetical protein
MSEERAKKWFPLESNPTVMNEFVRKLGFPVDHYRFCDVLSTEEWALEMVPKPVVGVVMLFPIKDHVANFSILALYTSLFLIIFNRRKFLLLKKRMKSLNRVKLFRNQFIICTKL